MLRVGVVVFLFFTSAVWQIYATTPIFFLFSVGRLCFYLHWSYGIYYAVAMLNPFDTTIELRSDISLQDHFLRPAFHVLENFSRYSRDCPQITDHDFLRYGCLRILSQAQSGRDFIQTQNEVFHDGLLRPTFFTALHSGRRQSLVDEVSWQLYFRGRVLAREQGTDLLRAFPELFDRAVWAVDGHQIEHACHALRDSKGRHVPPKSIYLLCLHSGLLLSLGAIQGNGRYQHEMRGFRAAVPGFLQMEFGYDKRKSRNKLPLFVLDPAYINHQFWTTHHDIRRTGACLVIRPKADMAPKEWVDREFDRTDPINLGVDADQIITFKSGIKMRLIKFTDPETRVCYQFLTTDFELRPGVIAWLYLLRWRIEKVFDTTKNKLQERKAWATGRAAAEIQSHFLAITHNLLVLFRDFLEKSHGIEEEKLKERRLEHLKKREQVAIQNDCRLHPLHHEMPAVVQMSVQYIRTLRNHITTKAALETALPRFKAMLISYL